MTFVLDKQMMLMIDIVCYNIFDRYTSPYLHRNWRCLKRDRFCLTDFLMFRIRDRTIWLYIYRVDYHRTGTIMLSDYVVRIMIDKYELKTSRVFI